VKARRLIIIGVLAALVISYSISIIPNFRRKAELKRTIAALQSLPRDRVEAAVQTFARDRKVSAGVVSLRELVSGGYLRVGDIRGLEGKDVAISPDADETTPSAIQIRVRSSEGFDIVLIADGSIQEIPRR
jgi:hypothetical protein